MDRKEFIVTTLDNSFRIVKIFLYIILFVYLIYFLSNAIISKDSEERIVIILGIIVVGIIIALGFVRYILDTIWNSFPEKTKTFLTSVNKILEYAILLFFIYFCYENWKENKLMILVFGAAYFISYLKNLKQTKPI
jgi:asparagine N-glycosylation enzyme membrane subunit Stt3